MRQNIVFNAEGTTIRGWFYTPDSGSEPFPTIIMAHGLNPNNWLSYPEDISMPMLVQASMWQVEQPPVGSFSIYSPRTVTKEHDLP